MYGLLLNSIFEVIRGRVGDEKWTAIKQKAGLDCCFPLDPFSINSESWIPRLVKVTFEETGISQDELMEDCGRSFVGYVERHLANNGSPLQLPVLGKTVRRFLNGIDNLHEYVRVAFPAMRAPSFHCEIDENDPSMVWLHYRTGRPGFVPYVIGQIREIARRYYGTELFVVEIKHQQTNESQDGPPPAAVADGKRCDNDRISDVNAAHSQQIPAFSCSWEATGVKEEGDHSDEDGSRGDSEEEKDQIDADRDDCPTDNPKLSPTVSQRSTLGKHFCYASDVRSKDSTFDVASSACFGHGEKSDYVEDDNHIEVMIKLMLIKSHLTFQNQSNPEPEDSDGKTEVMESAVNETTTPGEVERVCSNSQWEHSSSNAAVDDDDSDDVTEKDLLPVPDCLAKIDAHMFLDAFPFHILLDRNMTITSIGRGLEAVVTSSVVYHPVTQYFRLTRPAVQFTWTNVQKYSNNVFELKIVQQMSTVITTANELDESVIPSGSTRTKLRLKGQMLFVNEWDSVIYLCTPVIESLDQLKSNGLYVNDLSLHDCSRDLLFAGIQISAELTQSLQQEEANSRKLQETMDKLNAEMEHTNDLLYQMMPKTIADRLRSGDEAGELSQKFSGVTILFSDIVGFTSICSVISPLEVATMLNALYTRFDLLTEKHFVYKVETIGDAYMVVSGAPVVTELHAFHIADMALDMVNSMSDLTDPTSDGQRPIQIRIGINSGPVIAGVVGIKMPRYCMFGETVRLANQMEISGEAMKIQITEETKLRLDKSTDSVYLFERRNNVLQFKADRGVMKTYWLKGKQLQSNFELSQSGCFLVDERDDATVNGGKTENADAQI